jgi:hypothetical protein
MQSTVTKQLIQLIIKMQTDAPTTLSRTEPILSVRDTVLHKQRICKTPMSSKQLGWRNSWFVKHLA